MIDTILRALGALCVGASFLLVALAVGTIAWDAARDEWRRAQDRRAARQLVAGTAHYVASPRRPRGRTEA